MAFNDANLGIFQWLPEDPEWNGNTQGKDTGCRYTRYASLNWLVMLKCV